MSSEESSGRDIASSRASAGVEDDGPTESLPRRLGRYELRARIAEGGMAAVYVARRLDRAPGTDPRRPPPDAVEGWPGVVAVKRIRADFARDRTFRTMFVDEAQIVSRLRHPNIVRYFELAEEEEELFLVMELLSGQSLWSVWDACRARGVRLRYDVLAWIGARAADGLHWAHELRDPQGEPLGIVHRDVNATNVFVTYDGEIKIIDFGLAKAEKRESRTAAGVIKGKVAYMSPEQAVGAPIDRRTDVFALGTTLWELACDRRLFKRDDDVETLKRVNAAVVPDPTTIVAGFPEELWRVLERALARDKDRRYPTAAAMATDLDAFARRSGTGVGPARVAEILRELFATERARDAAWLADASAPSPQPPPREALRTTTSFLVPKEALGQRAPAPEAAGSGLQPGAVPRASPAGPQAAIVVTVVVAVLLAAAVAAVLALR